MLTKLTKEQELLQKQVVDEWIGYLGNIKLDKEKVQTGIEFLYTNANLNVPEYIIYVSSPLAMQYAYFLLSKLNDNNVRGNLWNSVIYSVRNSVIDSVIHSVSNNVWNSVRNSVWDSVWDSVRDSVTDNVWNSVTDNVRSSVTDNVRSSVRNSVWDSVWDSVRNSVTDNVWNSVWNSVRNSVRDSVTDNVRNSVSNSVWNSVRDSVTDNVRGNYQFMGNIGSIRSWGWVSFYDYFQRIGIELMDKFTIFKEYCCKSGAYDYLFYNNCAIVCEHPEYVYFNQENRLHSDTKPAIKWKDGFKLYSLNGTIVPEYLVITPKSDLDIEFFKKEENVDIKAEFIRKYGIERMVSLGTLVDTNKDYKNVWYHKSEYELYDMSTIFEDIDYAPFLKMKHQTMNMYCMEGVSPTCHTIKDALDFRCQCDTNKYEIIDIK